MKFIRTLTLGVGLVAVAAAGADDKAPAKLDPAKLVGDWKFVEGTKAGEKASDEALKSAVTVTKDMIMLKGGAAGDFEFKYKVKPDTTPAEIDLEITKPEGLMAKTRGIVKLADGKFTLCYHPMNESLPKEFKSTKDNGYYLFVMEKAKK